MEKTVVCLRGVTKYYDGQQVLDHINLSVLNGEFLTILGPSGCGKTTLLRLIAGFIDPDEGDILINAQRMNDCPPQQRDVRTVFQSFALFPHMTVFQNVKFALHCLKARINDIDKRVVDALAIVKLTAFQNRYPHQLSGGQQQRVALARAIINRPTVLLLDEPLSSLDYRLRKVMQIELKQLQRQLGITFIFITHDQEEALSISDRIVILNEGRIAQMGTPREVYEEPVNLKVAQFIGEACIFNSEVCTTTGKNMSVKIEETAMILPNEKQNKVGDLLHIMVRPEDLRVWHSSSAEYPEQSLSGHVEEVIYKGTTVDLIVRLSSGKKILATEFFNEDDDTLQYSIGERVRVGWIPSWEVILPYEKNQSL